MIEKLSTVRLFNYMKRFNSVNLAIESKTINRLIFDCESNSRNTGFGGFREKGFEKVKSRFFTFVFLCGGNRETCTSRSLLSSVLLRNADVKLIISENLESFKGNLDLLTFETVLEAISKMILIPIESYGTACELGAFTRINDSENKVVAILDCKHSNDRSFINYGPIQLLKNMNDQRVITASFQKQDNITSLLINSQIDSLQKHPLVTNDTKLRKYFIKNENDGQGVITDLNTFLTAVLDYVCLVGFATPEMVIDFYSEYLVDPFFAIRTNVMERDHSLVREIILVYFKILTSMNFLDEKNGIFFVNSETLAPLMKNGERWIGKILFTNEFTRTDEYLSIKCHCEEIKRKILLYGLN